MDELPVMYVSALSVLGTFDPSLHVDITHLLAGEKRVVFKYHVVSVPDDHSQLVTTHTHTHTMYTQCTHSVHCVHVVSVHSGLRSLLLPTNYDTQDSLIRAKDKIHTLRRR